MYSEKRSMNKDYGCVLLAGGMGSRMGYVDKRKLVWQDTELSEKAEKILKSFGRPCFLSVANYPCDSKEGWIVVRDRVHTRDGKFIGPLGGMLACLEEADSRGLKGLFFVPCDMPLFHREQIEVLESYADEGYDAALWRTRDGRIHPTCAYYAVSVTDTMRSLVKEENYCLMALLDAVNVRYTTTDEARLPDYWFTNVNTREEIYDTAPAG